MWLELIKNNKISDEGLRTFVTDQELYGCTWQEYR